jgi:glycosyltransferase involved in cell wall biosynthesis
LAGSILERLLSLVHEAVNDSGLTHVPSGDGEHGIPLAVLLPTDVVGGHEHMLLEWLTRASELGLQPTIYCRANWELPELVRKHRLVCEVGDYRVDRRDVLRKALWRNFITTLRIASGLPRDTPVMLAPGGMQFGLIHVLACLVARRSIVTYVPMTYDAVTMRIRWPRLRDWITARLTSRIAMWITISEEHSERLEAYWNVRAPVHVVPNRLRVLSGTPVRRRAGSRRNSVLRVLYAGRFDPHQKGLDWLAEVLGSNDKWMSTFSFVLQGRGPFLHHLEALSERLGAERVRVLAWGNIGQTLATVDLLLLTSRFEGLPLVALEAIWAGVPVVATVQSGLARILPEECLFQFGDVDAYRAALERMLTQDWRDAVVVHAQRKVRELLTENAYQSALERVISTLTSMRTRG